VPIFRTVPCGDNGDVRLERIDAPKQDVVEIDFFAVSPNRPRLSPHSLLHEPEWPRKYRGPRLRLRVKAPRMRKVRRGKGKRVSFDRVLP
jgi:hypothetical protein